MSNLFCGKGNFFWGNHLRYFGDKISLNERLVLFRSFRAKITQSTTAITSMVASSCRSRKSLRIVIRVANQLRIGRESAIIRHCEANRRFAKAIQKIIQQNLARFVVQKIGFKDAVVPSADFLLESELRGSPPKSEKRQLLARRGSGAGGAALLRKEKGETNIDCHDLTTSLTQNFRHTERSEVSKSRESNQVQNAMTQERMGESHRFAQSKKIVCDSQVAKMDSSLTSFAQNDEFGVDCFGQSPRNDDIKHDSLQGVDSRNDGFFDSTNRTRNYQFILTRSKF